MANTLASEQMERLPKILAAQDIERYHSLGYHAPIDVLSSAEAREYRRKVEEFEAEMGSLSEASNVYRHKSHLIFPWLDKLIRHPALLDAVEDVLQTPDLLVWTTAFFIKEANDPSFIAFHQDSTYWGLDSTNILTAWVAFADSTVENGALQVVPGSHLTEQIPHRENTSENNILTRGQEIEVNVLERDPVPLVLRAGQASFHNVRIVHGSESNRSNDRRIGFAIRYIPTYVKPTHQFSDNATLVRGIDRYGHFNLETPPTSEPDIKTIKMLKQYRQVLETSYKINYRNLEGMPQK